jgi:hypothetical protein
MNNKIGPSGVESVEWVENEQNEPTLVLHLSSTAGTLPPFSEQFHSHWPTLFLTAIDIKGIQSWENEQYADFTLCRFTFKDIVCILTIDNLSESIWITASTAAEHILSELKAHIIKTK